jgi:hypothetical protein
MVKHAEQQSSKWRTLVVKGLFVCLVALCSFTVAWFFAGAKYVPTIKIAQNQVRLIKLQSPDMVSFISVI